MWLFKKYLVLFLCRKIKHCEFPPADLTMSEVSEIIRCTNFAAIKHKDQKRKDKEGTPYINHPIGKFVVRLFFLTMWNFILWYMYRQNIFKSFVPFNLFIWIQYWIIFFEWYFIISFYDKFIISDQIIFFSAK